MAARKATWLSSRLPQITRNSREWSQEVHEQLKCLKEIIDSCCSHSLFNKFSDEIDAFMNNLRTPTIQEIIHENALAIQKSLTEGSATALPENSFVLLDENGERLKYPSENKHRLHIVSPKRPIDWSEEKLILHNRLTISLESYKLSNDFNNRRFKRYFASYNFTPHAHKNITKQLNEIKAKQMKGSSSPRDSAHYSSTVLPSQSYPSQNCSTHLNRKALVPKWITPVPVGSNSFKLQKNPDNSSCKSFTPCCVFYKEKKTLNNFTIIPSPGNSLRESSEAIRMNRSVDFTWSELGKETILITISFYHALRGFKLAEFDVPDYFNLAQLKDAFFCDEDLCSYAQNCKISFFYINGIFYYDSRHSDIPLSCRRLSMHMKRARSKEASQEPLWLPMEETILSQLTIPFNSRCAYMHRGDCEHRVMFTSMRLFSSKVDSPYENAYPLLIYKPTTRVTQCQACLVNLARKTIIQSSRLPQSAVQLCRDCFNSFFFNEDGTCVTDEDFLHFDFHDTF